MSRKIRLGNDIDITWSLLDKDENPYIVEGREFEVEVVFGIRKYRMCEVTASGNQIHFVFYGKDQKTLGNASLVYIENGGHVDMVTFDTKDAFEMVPHSWQAVDPDEHPETVTLDVVTVLSNLQSSIGPRGYSAYELAVQHGYTGTEEEWLASLKPHITADENGNVYCDGVLLTDVIYSVVSAVTVGEQGRQEAETTRQTQETARQTAEGQRAAAEESRATQSSTDHQRAENDHSRADQDHQATANAVLYTQQTLTDEQKAQARTNIGATAPEIFWATYGVTTVAEIEAALNAGKIVAMLYSNKVYFVTANNATNYLVFTSPSDDTIFNIRVNRSDSSYGNTFNLTYEQAARKKSTISGNESSDAYYPTTKAVADAIEAGKQIFWAEYGVNTLSEITTAYNSGKAVLCLRQGALYVISKLETTYCYFTCVNRTASQFLLLNGQTSWSAGTVSLQSTVNLSQSVPTDFESTTKYPSVKAVADAISNLAQSLTASSKKIWAGTAAEYALLTPSDDTIYFIKP